MAFSQLISFLKIAASRENVYLYELSNLFVSQKMQAAGIYICDGQRDLCKEIKK